MGFVVYVKNNFLQKIGKFSSHLLMHFDRPFRESSTLIFRNCTNFAIVPV